MIARVPAMSRLERAVLFGLPTLAGVAVAFVLVGPGARRTVEAARVHGLPTSGAREGVLRVEVVRRYGDLEVPGEGSVDIDWSQAGNPLGTAVGRIEGTGWGDVAVPFREPLVGRATLTVCRGGRLLVTGDVEASPSPLVLDASACESSGDLEVCVPRGVAVPELPERVLIKIRIGAAVETAVKVKLDAPGGDVMAVAGADTRRCEGASCLVVRAFDVVARAPSVPLDVEVAGAVSARLHGELPLRPGGLWLDPTATPNGALRVRSATPRSVAYASLVTREGRLWGGPVPLDEKADGTSMGSVAWPEGIRADLEGATLVLSSEPDEPAERAVAWPLTGSQRVEPATMRRLLDGVPAAMAREEARVRAVRWPVAGAIVASAAALLATLALRIRRSRERFDRHLEGAGAEAPIAALPLGLMIAVLALVAVAFFVLALVAAHG